MSDETPTPWSRKDSGDYSEIFAANGNSVALVRREDDGNVIAAAPEVLKALRTLIEMHDRMKTVGVMPADYGIVAGAAHAAIEKAEGRNG